MNSQKNREPDRHAGGDPHVAAGSPGFTTLEDLLGVADGDQEDACARCGELFMVRDGDYRTKYCHDCAHAIIEGNDL